MLVTYTMFKQAVTAMREQGIVHRHMPLVLNLSEVKSYYLPRKFYWDDKNEPTDQAMIYGPIYHNDNIR